VPNRVTHDSRGWDFLVEIPALGTRTEFKEEERENLVNEIDGTSKGISDFVDIDTLREGTHIIQTQGVGVQTDIGFFPVTEVQVGIKRASMEDRMIFDTGVKRAGYHTRCS